MKRGDRLLNLKEVTDRVGIGKTALYEWMGEGKFPRPCAVGRRAVRWRESEIDKWIASLPPATT